MEWQHGRERDYGQEQPWREERRDRYPDEQYGGERDRGERGGWLSSRGRDQEGMRRWSADDRSGADYRGDFGPEGRHYFRREQPSGRGWNTPARESDWEPGEGRREERGWDSRDRTGSGGARDRWNTGGSFGFGPDERVDDRSRYGSPYGQGDVNTDRAGHGDWRDSDWTPNRAARGRGTWAGDWSDTRSTIGMAGFSGRGPKDYRRSDDRIREEVCDVFTDDDRLDASEVSVRVENGDVTLMGTVATREQKRRAEDVAERVSGVRDVINQLRVSRGETTGGPASQPGREKTARGAAAPPHNVAADRERER